MCQNVLILSNCIHSFFSSSDIIFSSSELLSSAYKAVKSFLTILLVTYQSGTNSNAARQSSTASLYICWVLSQSGTCRNENGSSEITL